MMLSLQKILTASRNIDTIFFGRQQKGEGEKVGGGKFLSAGKLESKLNRFRSICYFIRLVFPQ